MQGYGLDTVDRAKQLVQSGELAKARSLVRRTLAADPAFASALTLAGQIAIRESSVDDALRHFGRAARVDDHPDPRALMNLARAEAMAGHGAAAIATARSAAVRFPDDPRPRGLLAVLLLDASRVEEAVAALKPGDTERLDPDSAYRIAKSLATADHHKRLADRLLARAASQPGRFRLAAHRDLALAATPEGDGKEAYEALQRYLVQVPDAVDGMRALERFFKARNYPVKEAAWAWQAYCARPGDPAQLARAAELAYAVKWPAHGIAANRLMLEARPNDLDLITRICELFDRYRQLDEDKDGIQARALAWARSILDTNPRHPGIWNMIAGMYKAVEAFEQVSEMWPGIIARFPGYRVLHYNYGLFLDEQQRTDEAIKALRRALVLAPGYAIASNLLSMGVVRGEDLKGALRYVRWAVVSSPRKATCWTNYGSHLRAVGEYTKAIEAFGNAERFATDDPEQAAAGRYNRGMTYISIGELEEGFKLIEARWQTHAFPSPKRKFRQRIWEGPQKHPNSHLLVYMEQGLGDEVMMSWYLPMLRRDTRRLLVDCDERLIPLFERTYEGIEFVPRSREGHDKTRDRDLQFKIPIVHVPQHYVPELKFLIRGNWDWAERRGTRFPARLTLEPERLARWDRWLEERYPGRPRLGLSWRSRIRNRQRDRQYLTIEELAAALPEGAVGVNLQYSWTEEEAEQLTELGRKRGFDFVTPEGVDLTDDLEDILALLQVCDAAVSPMISLAWMAGAVGCPGFIFRTARERAIWQQFGSAFVPWAPSMRLFFRDPSEPWDPTIDDLNAHLTRFLASDTGRRG